MQINNSIEAQYRNFMADLDYEYLNLYKSFNNEKLASILATIHALMIKSMKRMNERLPTESLTAHFWADDSRVLLKAIDGALSLRRGLKNSEFAFDIDNYYERIIKQCSDFLVSSGGSIIPVNMEKINLYYTIPIFVPSKSISIKTLEGHKNYKLTLLGEGSYAHVYKFLDTFYNKSFILKRAKNSLNEKELIRFEKEFNIMSELKSPYIIEVFSYSKEKNEYIMEYMDTTLYDYINKHNQTLTKEYRRSIGIQILKAFSYINSKKILHRDICRRVS